MMLRPFRVTGTDNPLPVRAPALASASEADPADLAG